MAAGLCGPGRLDARPLVPAERRYSPFEPWLPFCDDPAVLGRIQSRFEGRESEFWSTGLTIVAFDRINEIGYRSNGLDHIPRRYCVGRAILNNQNVRSVSYSIVQDMGIMGFGYGVEWCVAGLDRLDAFAPNCTMAQP
jgi:hypothetical protein